MYIHTYIYTYVCVYIHVKREESTRDKPPQKDGRGHAARRGSTPAARTMSQQQRAREPRGRGGAGTAKTEMYHLTQGGIQRSL